MFLLATERLQTALRLGAGYAGVFTDTGKMYVLGAVVLLVIFLLVRVRLPAEKRFPIRLILLLPAMTADIFLGARFIVDWLL
jgi:hypothetical protein